MSSAVLRKAVFEHFAKTGSFPTAAYLHPMDVFELTREFPVEFHHYSVSDDLDDLANNSVTIRQDVDLPLGTIRCE